MARAPRGSTKDGVFHVINRGNDRRALFDGPDDYDAFVALMTRALSKFGMRVLAFCLMPNHWHMVLWSRADLDLGRFLGWIAQVHAQRLRRRDGTTGEGHVYQDRFHSFRIDGDEHYLTVCRYVERNALAADLVGAAEDWNWCSLRRRCVGVTDDLLTPWPCGTPSDWLENVNGDALSPDLNALHPRGKRGRPRRKSESVAVSPPRRAESSGSTAAQPVSAASSSASSTS